MKQKIELTTARLLVRTPDEQDVQDVFSLMSDTEIAQDTGFRPMDTPSEAEGKIRRGMNNLDLFVIAEKSEPAHAIGVFEVAPHKVTTTSGEKCNFEICYFLHRNARKRLTPEQILCLQWWGCTAHDILNADNTFFEETARIFGNRTKDFLDKAASLLEKQELLGIHTYAFHHTDFPDGLKQTGDDCPPLIHLLGNKALLGREAVAIVGARAADKRGREAAYKWGAAYARQGKIIISGLALGCDTAAHQGCLAAQGETLAIVATGLDLTHPKENRLLQERILDRGGLLLSEQPIGVKANPTRLVARNRLQAALSQEVVVAQCPVRSGTMHTVRFARKYGKRIYATRFNRFDENSSGNEFLIEAGWAQPL